MPEIVVTITGMDELIKKVNDPELLGQPLRKFLTNSALMIQRNVQILTPVDMGQLRASETFSVDSSPFPLWARVGTNVAYAPFVEEDTRPHWTSVKNLMGWAHRHNINPYAIQRKIAKYGTTGKHMFLKGFEQSKDTVISFLKEMAADIETKWERR